MRGYIYIGLYRLPRGFVFSGGANAYVQVWQFSGTRFHVHIGVFIVALLIIIAVGLPVLVDFWVAPFVAATRVFSAVFKEGRKASFAA